MNKKTKASLKALLSFILTLVVAFVVAYAVYCLAAIIWLMVSIKQYVVLSGG